MGDLGGRPCDLQAPLRSHTHNCWNSLVQDDVALQRSQQLPGSSPVEVQWGQRVAPPAGQHQEVPAQREASPAQRVELREGEGEGPRAWGDTTVRQVDGWTDRRADRQADRQQTCVSGGGLLLSLHRADHGPVRLVSGVKPGVLLSVFSVLTNTKLLLGILKTSNQVVLVWLTANS